MDWLSAPTAGSYADWVAAVGTVGTLTAAVLVLRRESADRQARQSYERGAQGRQVRLSQIQRLGGGGNRGQSHSWDYAVTLHNESSEAAYSVTLQMRIPSGDRFAGTEDDWWEELSAALPGGATLELKARFTVPWPATEMDPPEVKPTASATFTDAADQEWSRSTRDFRLRRIERQHRRHYRLFGEQKTSVLISRDDRPDVGWTKHV